MRQSNAKDVLHTVPPRQLIDKHSLMPAVMALVGKKAPYVRL